MKSLAALLTKATQLHQSGQVKEALAIYERVLPHQPRHAGLRALVGTANLALGNTELAIKHLQLALSLDPKNAQSHAQLGKALERGGQPEKALSCFEAAIQIAPDNLDAHLGRALLLRKQNKLESAIVSYKKLSELKPENAEIHNNMGVALALLGRREEAVVCFGTALNLRAGWREAHINRGEALRELQQWDLAIEDYARVLAMRSDDADALFGRADALYNLGEYRGALDNIDQLADARKDTPDSLNLRASILTALGEPNEALDVYDQILSKSPRNRAALANKAKLLVGAQQLDKALELYDAAVEWYPQDGELLVNRAVVLALVESYESALQDLEMALSLGANGSKTYLECGGVLAQMHRHEEALSRLDEALARDPELADAYNRKGNSLTELNRLEDALWNYEKALELQPTAIGAHSNRGLVLQRLNRPREAIQSLNKVLEADPKNQTALYNRAFVYTGLFCPDEAVVDFEALVALRPDYEFAMGAMLHTQMKLCRWEHHQASLPEFERRILTGEPVGNPFAVLGLVDDPEVQKKAAETLVKIRYSNSIETLRPLKTSRNPRINVGYYSADFHNHATAYLIAELFEHHDGSRFEFHGFSFGNQKDDDFSKRIRDSFTHFHEVDKMSDKEVASLSRSLGIDIAIDLKGYTQGSRPGMFAHRCAPLQVNYLGFPGTMGAEFMDYIIADRVVIPESARQFYTEKTVYLPGSYQVNDSTRAIAAREFSREEAGLPRDGTVFCCFNNNWKILPPTFHEWMQIIAAVDDSVLWLLEDNPTAARNLRREAEARGINPNRLIFAKRMRIDEHLARHACADLFLDTVPCNAHTTASDALWAGLPVLTCAGKSFAARVAASLLHALNMPELVTHTLEDYTAEAIRLARDPGALEMLRQKLAVQRTSSTLFDGRDFARKLERAFIHMHERASAGLPPEDFEVSQLTS